MPRVVALKSSIDTVEEAELNAAISSLGHVLPRADLPGSTLPAEAQTVPAFRVDTDESDATAGAGRQAQKLSTPQRADEQHAMDFSNVAPDDDNESGEWRVRRSIVDAGSLTD